MVIGFGDGGGGGNRRDLPDADGSVGVGQARLVHHDGLDLRDLVGPEEAQGAEFPRGSAIVVDGVALRQGVAHGHHHAAQKMLNYKRSAGLTTDGWFGKNTKNAVIAYQKKAFPNKPREWDGICGPKTWEALFRDCSVKRGDKNNLVLIVQHILNKVDNQTLNEDRDFGYATYCAVWNFQSKHGLGKDGEVGPETWNELIYQYNKLSFDTAFSKK